MNRLCAFILYDIIGAPSTEMRYFYILYAKKSYTNKRMRFKRRLGRVRITMINEMTKNIGDDRFAEYVGIKLIEVSDGYAVARMDICPFHMNGVGVVHGGASFTLADYAFAAASNTQSSMTLGINASMSYFKAPKGKYLTAIAKRLSDYTKITGYCVNIYDESDDLVATFSGLGYAKRKPQNEIS